MAQFPEILTFPFIKTIIMKTKAIMFIATILLALAPYTSFAQHNMMGTMSGSNMQKQGTMQTQEQQMQSVMHYDVDNNFKNHMTAMYKSYMGVKNALVADNAGEAGKMAGQMMEQLNKVDATNLDKDATEAWNGHYNIMTTNLKKIMNSDNLSMQRMAFSNVSSSMYQCVKSFGMNNMSGYYQYCPMANGGQGAYWMSTNKNIQNPYMGGKMMTCGKTMGTF